MRDNFPPPLPDLDHLSTAEAVQLLADEMDALRAAISQRGRRRAEIVLAAVEADGQRGAARRVAEEVDLSESAVNKLVHEARKNRQDRAA
jgi:hypothetical protein